MERNERIKQAVLKFNAETAKGPTHEAYNALVEVSRLVPAVKPMVDLWNRASWRIKVLQEAILTAVDEIT